MSTWMRVLIDTRPLRGGAYRRLWVSTLVTSVGSMLTAVAVPLQIYQVTGSSAYVGLLGAVTLVPLVVFGLWGGTVADAVDRRKLLLVTDSGLVVTSVLLWAQAAAGLRSVWLLLALAGVQQAFAGAGGSAHGAAVARLVTAELLPAANALHATVRQLGAIVGPLLAGAALPFVGVATLYLADAVALGVTVWAVWGLPSIPPLDGSPRRPGGRSLVAGLGYLVGQKLLLMVLVSDLVAMVFGMPTALFPELAQETFGDPRGGGPALGLLFAAWPIGYTLAGALSGAVTRLRRHGAMVTVAVCAWGLAVVGLGLSRTLLLAVLCFALGRRGLLRPGHLPQDDPAVGSRRRGPRPDPGRGHGRVRRRPAPGRRPPRSRRRRARHDLGDQRRRPPRDRPHAGRRRGVPRLLALPRPGYGRVRGQPLRANRLVRRRAGSPHSERPSAKLS